MSEVTKGILRSMDAQLKEYCSWLPGYIANQSDPVNGMELWAFYRLLTGASVQLDKEVLHNGMIDWEKI